MELFVLVEVLILLKVAFATSLKVPNRRDLQRNQIMLRWIILRRKRCILHLIIGWCIRPLHKVKGNRATIVLHGVPLSIEKSIHRAIVWVSEGTIKFVVAALVAVCVVGVEQGGSACVAALLA